jgi:peptidylprolyl isomerase
VQPVATKSSSSSYGTFLIVGLLAVAFFFVTLAGLGVWLWLGRNSKAVDQNASPRPTTIMPAANTQRVETWGNEVTTASGLKYVDILEGTGENPRVGQTVVVHYIGRLENGKKFDSSYDRNQPTEFKLGIGHVIKGWDEGLMSMKVGGKRTLLIPPTLGFGPRGRPPDVPGNATVVFEVELLGVK